MERTAALGIDIRKKTLIDSVSNEFSVGYHGARQIAARMSGSLTE